MCLKKGAPDYPKGGPCNEQHQGNPLITMQVQSPPIQMNNVQGIILQNLGFSSPSSSTAAGINVNQNPPNTAYETTGIMSNPQFQYVAYMETAPANVMNQIYWTP
jgi:hypothetical protein